MSKNDQVLIFDLDETILSVNSFPYWVKTMLFGPFDGLRMTEIMKLRLQSMQALLERKLLGRSHSQTKRQLQIVWKEALAKDPGQKALRHVCAALERTVRPNMELLLASVKKGACDAILATSAAGEYADALGRQLGFTHSITTDQVENRHQQKRDNVMAMLAALGWSGRKRVFFTDHEEDLPFIKESNLVLWFGSPEKAEQVKKEAPGVELHICTQHSAVEIMQLLGMT